MKKEDIQLIMIPGLGGSGESHWQTLWEKEDASIVRVEQADWDNPICQIWVDQLEKTLLLFPDKPMVLIAHSLGCVTLVHAYKQNKLKNVVGAFLVAMPDVLQADFPKECLNFSPLPNVRFDFPSIMIASSNDSYSQLSVLEDSSLKLGCLFINIGNRGHIGTAANLGFWEEGKSLFLDFLKQL